MNDAMLGTLLGILITVLQCFAGVLFFDIFLKRRLTGLRFWGMFAALTILFGWALNDWHIPVSFVKMAFSTLLFLILGLSLYSGGVVFRILVSCLFYALLNGFDVIVVYAVLKILNVTLERFRSSYSLVIAASVAEQMLGMAVLLLAQKLLRPKKMGQGGWRLWLAPLLLSSGSTAVSIYLLRSSVAGQTDAGVVLVCTVFLVCINLLVIVLIDWLEQNSRYREESLALNEKLHAQAESVEALSNAYTMQRRLTHDYTAHLVSLYGYLNEGDYGRAKEYTRELISQQNERLLAVNTHNAALDALLNQKAFVARKQGIDLRFVVSDLSGLEIRVSDLTVVISNLMDNAIEASVRLPRDQREIEVRAILEETFLFSVRNRSLPVTIVDGTIPSTKPDPSMHGYGLANVRTILAQYSECYHDMTYKNGWFSYLVELPNLPRS